MTRQELAAKIDHTILKANATFEEIKAAIDYAGRAGTASVCLNPAYVALAADMLKNTHTAVCTVIGFPLGANSTYTKAKETETAYRYGCREMDMVLNISALVSANYDYVMNDIAAVVNASPAPVKVILETCYLSDAQIEIACRLAAEAGAAFVKTSTGFGPAGASVKHVRLMRASIPAEMQVKASGGIRTLKDAQAMLRAGASRLGMSSTAAVLDALDAAATAKKTAAKGALTKRSAAKKTTPKAAAAKKAAPKAKNPTAP